MNHVLRLSCCLALAFSCASCLHSVRTVEGLPQHDVPTAAAAPASRQLARHVILMIGDGMGSEHVWAAWACNGGKLNLERLPVNGWSATSSASHAITDSAAGGTAIACGERTANLTIGQSADGHPFTSIATELQRSGWRSGLVVTKSITDATPAAFYAHVPRRYDTARIASQLGESGLSVVLGGGADDVPASVVRRLRGQGALVELSAPHNLPPASRRGDYLPQAVGRALEKLGQGDKPFFLMVEGSQIDVASHYNDLPETMAEVLEFDRALGVVLRWAETHPDTLVIVMADHQTGGLAIHDADMASGRVSAVFTTFHHSGLSIPVYAAGAGAQYFSGIYENRSIAERIRRACGRSATARKDSKNK